MRITLLGQGFESISDNSVGKKLIAFLSDKDFNSFTGMSAFSRLAGINGLSKYINEAKKHLKSITIITGVDQKGTTKEALEAILALKINSFIFYAPPPFPIFHSKIYLFEGKKRSELIIGSSNLTSTGLFSNIETSLLISIDNTIKDDKKIIEQLKKYFKGIFDFTDPNLKKISKKLIANFVKEEIVPTEVESKKAFKKELNIEETAAEKIISKIFPKREFSKIPREFRSYPKSKVASQNETIDPVFIKSKLSKLLWESGPLKERDLNIPKGSNTNNTGSMLIKKGLLKNIDQRHYFRDTVFASLNWVKDTHPRTLYYERAKAKFRIIVDDKDFGVFELTLSHDNNTEKKSYKQNQPMTKLSWGIAKKFIAKEELLGKNARIFKGHKKGEFTLEIT